LLRRLRIVLAGRDDPEGEFISLALMREIGIWLWKALLPESAPVQELDALAQALRTELTPLLLTLPDPLSELPWELLYDPAASDERGFLAQRRPLLRFAPSETHPNPLPSPLRILVLISSPLSLGEDSRVDVESERAAIEEATREARESGLLYLLIEDDVTLERVQQALTRFKPHIVHFIGHGGYDENNGGFLLWENDQGKALPFSDVRLATLLRPRGLHAVVLHACKTGNRNERIDISGVAGTLIKEGLPAVLAQQGNFSYTSSQRASRSWYTALVSGQSLAEALFEVRQALALSDRPDWAVPVLYGGPTSLVPFLDTTVSTLLPDPTLTSNETPGDFPAPTGVFVGRHNEMRALRLMLDGRSHGKTMALLLGPGGIGKSTLAAQALARYGKYYKGTLTLSCLEYTDSGLFLQRIAQFLQERGSPGLAESVLPEAKLSPETKIEETILALNVAGPFLLVIDNLESVQNEDQTIRDPELLFLLQKVLTNLRGGRVIVTGRYAIKGFPYQGKFAANILRLDLDDLSSYEIDRLLDRHSALAQLGEATRAILINEFGGFPYVYDLLSSDAASQSLEQLLADIQGRVTAERQQRSAQEWNEIRQQVIEFTALDVAVTRLAEPTRRLLSHLSVLQQPFPLQVIEQGLETPRSVWQPLLDWSLLRFNASERTYRLHSLTKQYAEPLLEEQERPHVQAQLGTWYERYATQESHELSDYLEAHRLYRAAGEKVRAGTLAMRMAGTLIRYGLYPLLRTLCITTFNDVHDDDKSLTGMSLHQMGIIAQDQGDYPEARRLYAQSLAIKEQLGDLNGKANTLHQMGMIAQKQGDYPEARRLYAQSLAIYEQLGNLSGKATTFGQLGILAQKQGNIEEALDFLIQAFLLFEQLHSPNRTLVQQLLTRIRSHIDEHSFLAHWQAIAGDHPLPPLVEEKNTQSLIQTAIAFMQTPTWNASQQFLETHPELLSPDIDSLLEQLALEIEDEQTRQSIEAYRQLLRRCREIGIAAAFAALINAAAEQDTENSTTAPTSQNEPQSLTLEDLPRVIARVIQQGTQEDCQRLAEALVETQHGLSEEQAAISDLLGCFVSRLHGEIPDASILTDTLIELWQELEILLASDPKPDEQEKKNG
nr:CHAT domain-containing protein [Ktedonobacteraceae bacterium]